MPSIRSPIFGMGTGVISMSPDIDSSVRAAFGLPRASGRVLEASAIFDCAVPSDHRFMTIHNEADDASVQLMRAFARQMARDEVPSLRERLPARARSSWIALDNGVFVPCVPAPVAESMPPSGHINIARVQEPIIDLIETAAREFPMHRIRGEMHQETRVDLAACFARIRHVVPERFREATMRAIKAFLMRGYPYPESSVRWTFLARDQPSRGDYLGLTWVADEPNYSRIRHLTPLCLGIGRSDDVPTIDDPDIDATIASSPISFCALAEEMPPKEWRDKSGLVRAIDEYCIDEYRTAFMFPVAVAHISESGEITSF